MSYRWTSLFDVVFMIDGSKKMSQLANYPVVKFIIKQLIDQYVNMTYHVLKICSLV